MLKVAYSFGLRSNELRHLQLVNFARNSHAPEFGKYGVCKVRFGKSRRAAPPKPRAVLTVFSWTPEVIQDWVSNGRGSHDTLDVFPNESGALVSEPTLLRRLRRSRSWTSPPAWTCTPCAVPARMPWHSCAPATCSQAMRHRSRPVGCACT